MAAVDEMPGDGVKNLDFKRKQKSESEFNVQNLVDMFTKLNPLAKEFFPSSYKKQFGDYVENMIKTQFSDDKLDKNASNKENSQSNRKKRNGYIVNKGKRILNGKTRAQQKDSIRRTVYVSDIDQHVTEEHLAALFSHCGQVIDCRICGDPHSFLRFAFVEFDNEQSARAALNLNSMMLGYYPVKVLPSKTAILPVNPSFLPRSDDEREMCSRTVYCTHIDKKVSQAEVKNFFETECGEVTCLRLLGDSLHSTRIAFVEFWMAECAIAALNCSGKILGTQPIRVSPSKTPVRSRDA